MLDKPDETVQLHHVQELPQSTQKSFGKDASDPPGAPAEPNPAYCIAFARSMHARACGVATGASNTTHRFGRQLVDISTPANPTDNPVCEWPTPLPHPDDTMATFTSGAGIWLFLTTSAAASQAGSPRTRSPGRSATDSSGSNAIHRATGQRCEHSSDSTSVRPSPAHIHHGVHGKPALAQPFDAENIDFNVSHSNGLGRFAFSRRETRRRWTSKPSAARRWRNHRPPLLLGVGECRADSCRPAAKIAGLLQLLDAQGSVHQGDMAKAYSDASTPSTSRWSPGDPARLSSARR